ncbi:putative lipoprotein [Escherichia coli]|nr:putative lipoprotein [Escherichia coli]
MNKFLFAAALIVSGLLVGCNQLTQYTITEQELTSRLRNIIISQKISVYPAWLTPILF